MESPALGLQSTVLMHSPMPSAYLPGYLLGGRASPPLSGKQFTPGQMSQGSSDLVTPHQLFSDRRKDLHQQKMSPMIHQTPRDKPHAPPVEGLCESGAPNYNSPFSSPLRSSRLMTQTPLRPGTLTGETTVVSSMETSPSTTALSHDLIPQSPAQLDPFYTQGEALTTNYIPDDTWVTIFGFPPAAASYILQQFSQNGSIIQHEIPNDGNWMHVQYQTKLQAKKALSKNGKIFSGKIMIGVRPCIEKRLMSGETPANSPITVASPASTKRPTTMRPLTAAYRAATENLQVVQDGQGTPTRSTSMVSKVMEHLLGW